MVQNHERETLMKDGCPTLQHTFKNPIRKATDFEHYKDFRKFTCNWGFIKVSINKQLLDTKHRVDEVAILYYEKKIQTMIPIYRNLEKYDTYKQHDN